MAKKEHQENKNGEAVAPATEAEAAVAPATEAEAAVAPATEAEAAVAAVAPATEAKVIVTVPKAYRLRINNDVVLDYAAGVQKMDVSHAEHWYSKANGVSIFS